jgi:hypothetical protein
MVFVHRVEGPRERHRYIMRWGTLAGDASSVLAGPTAAARLLSDSQAVDAVGLAAALAGCNLAWGIIDAVFYLLGARFNRNQRVQFLRKLQAVTDEARAVELIREEFGLEGEPPMREEDRTAFHKSLLQMLRHAGTSRARFLKEDFVAAFLIVILVSATAIPGVLPPLLLDDGYKTLRIATSCRSACCFWLATDGPTIPGRARGVLTS